MSHDAQQGASSHLMQAVGRSGPKPMMGDSSSVWGASSSSAHLGLGFGGFERHKGDTGE